MKTTLLLSLLMVGLFPLASNAQDVCDVTAGTFNGESWSLQSGWAWRDGAWGYHYAEGDKYRFVGGTVYIHFNGVWKKWNGYGNDWTVVSAPACDSVAPETTPPSSCDTTDIFAGGTRWFISGATAFVTVSFGDWNIGPGDFYRFIDGNMYLNTSGTWHMWHWEGGGWTDGSPPACPSDYSSGGAFSAAIWNIYGGSGTAWGSACEYNYGSYEWYDPSRNELLRDGTLYPGRSVSYGTGTAMWHDPAQPIQNHIRDQLLADSSLVVVGFNEIRDPASIENLWAVFRTSGRGWENSGVLECPSDLRNGLVARYGFASYSCSPAFSQNDGKGYSRAIVYGQVCLDAGCSRTANVFSLRVAGYFKLNSTGDQREFQTIWNFVSPILANGLPTVVMGDFNSYPEHPVPVALRAHGLIQAPGGYTGTFGPEEDLFKNIDHLYVAYATPSTTTVGDIIVGTTVVDGQARRGQCALSDHAWVKATVSF